MGLIFISIYTLHIYAGSPTVYKVGTRLLKICKDKLILFYKIFILYINLEISI
jgi:hypothetical protein